MSDEQRIRLGRLTKPFGVRGEVRLSLDPAIADLNKAPEVLFLEEEDRLFPWFVRSWEEHGDGAIVLAFEGIDSPERVRRCCGHDVWIDAGLVQKDGIELGRRDLIGYAVLDQEMNEIGPIVEVLDATAQWLAVVQYQGRELLLPLDEALILDLNEDQRRLQLQVADGLLDL